MSETAERDSLNLAIQLCILRKIIVITYNSEKSEGLVSKRGSL